MDILKAFSGDLLVFREYKSQTVVGKSVYGVFMSELLSKLF